MRTHRDLKRHSHHNSFTSRQGPPGQYLRYLHLWRAARSPTLDALAYIGITRKFSAFSYSERHYTEAGNACKSNTSDAMARNIVSLPYLFASSFCSDRLLLTFSAILHLRSHETKYCLVNLGPGWLCNRSGELHSFC